MEVLIRDIREDDIPSVVDIQIEGWRKAYKGIIDDEYLDSMNRDERINNRKRDYNQGTFIVALVNGKIVGFCRYYDEVKSPDSVGYDSEIMALYVEPTLKHQGIGRKMFEHVKNDLKCRGRKKMMIWCLKENYPSRLFYEKMGGVVVSEHDIDFGGKLYQEVGFGYDL